MSLDAMTASGALSLDVGSALPSAPRPPTRREREAARARTQRREAAAKGLCISCPPRRRRSARPGKKTCVDCAKRSRTYDRKSLKAAQKAGLCGRCRKVPREVGALCKGCDERVKSYPSHGTNVTRERRADENLCANGCGGSAFDRKLCLDCAGDENAKDRARREERIAQGLCYRCGKRPAPPHKGCSTCVKGRRSMGARRLAPRCPEHKKRCGVCGALGHRRSSRKCPKWVRRTKATRPEPQEARRG